ncbi:shikimate dehydrogenase [Clostridium kluyveri]|uniref:Shikimate dehydrogenase (NADP(+)) n=1 Tax=Clostridium kluyveri TaxID=1534 RepID=A0A1L5F574_CLOKL|nr:shikimate dehydrogenase [Clostridium kluyveri]APM38171.1 shikimate dehydrogenase [Clostridium kluyveri]UZQ51819.1 shikimate dehydrogenase [Clostridium kluyveri]
MGNFYGLIGAKLGHSFSPVIHEMILKKINLQGKYNLFEIESQNLGEAIGALKILGCRGVNVTIPYKIKIMKYMDYISEEALNIGSINTIQFIDNKLKAYNTDYYGFGMTLKRYEIDVLNKSVIILGTGGASKAVLRYSMDKGAKSIIYVSRKPENVSNGEVDVISYEQLHHIKNGDIVINSTPCGMYPQTDTCAVDSEILSKFNTAVDLVYNPQETMFLKTGEKLGLKTANGLYMLVAQAVAAQQIWQDGEISLKTLDEIYYKLLNMQQ